MRWLQRPFWSIILLVIAILNCALLFLNLYAVNNSSISTSPTWASITTDTTKPRILYCIASAAMTRRLDVVEELLEDSRDWCEAGFSVEVIVDTFDQLQDERTLSARLTAMMGCSKSLYGVRVVSHPAVNSQGMRTNLIIAHREHFKREMSLHDIFIFGIK